jgi:predicted Na+-dependent transporter
VTADQLLTALFNAGIAISVGATVLSLGMTFTVGQLVAPLHRVVLVIGLVVLNAGVIPAAAWGIAEITPMSSKYVPGLVLATLAAGSAASLKAAQLAKRADLPLAVSVVVVLQLVNIVAVPLWAGQVVTGASISAWDIVKSLLLLVLLPLVVGLFIRARYADRAKDWQPGLVKVANIALVIALALPRRRRRWAGGHADPDPPGKLLALDGDLAKAEPKTLRYKILHTAGRIVKGQRRRHLKIPPSWPWAEDIAAAFTRILALPPP